MFEEMLPIGTVVLLNNGIKKSMIIGYKQIDSKNPEKIYDYCGVMYPIGSLGLLSQFMFDAKDILKIVYEGYRNSEFEDFKAQLREYVSEHPGFETKE